MTNTYFPLAPQAAAMAEQALILTANNRLRNHLLRAFTQAQTQQAPCPRPRVMTLQQWFSASWERLQWADAAANQNAIASDLQRKALWQSIINNSSLASGLLQPGPLAQAADAALRNLELWQLSESDVRQAEPWFSQDGQSSAFSGQASAANNLGSASNSQSFLLWLGEFRARLASLGLITQEQALAELSEAYATQTLARENAIWLLGFDDIPPLQHSLLNAACHTLHRLPGATAESAQVWRTQCLNAEQEMLAAARWSKTVLAQNPEAMIGIIVPNLGQCRSQLERAFTAVFEPLAPLPSQPRFTLPFNFSAGTPLGNTPIIAASLALLGLYQNHWPLEEICSLLLSPFWGECEAELNLRCQLVDKLRELGRFSISGSDLRYWAERLEKTHTKANPQSRFSQYLLQLETHRRDSFGKNTASYWSHLFSQLLQHLNWPGERCLDSQEHQQLAQWNQLLEHFAELDSTATPLSYSAALQQLRQIALQTPFQAQTPLSPIQILGALESSGLVFSHCWVMGLHHRQWPAAPSPNPLLPINLQREQQMPHANAERELVFARSLTQHYRQCAQQVIFSSATGENDQALSPSALIRDIPLTPLAELVPNSESLLAAYWQQLANSQALDALYDNQGPAVGEQETIRGGASIFKEQAACPFNAFARLRLGATAANAPVAGFSPIERGNILHQALADIWRKLGSRQQLLQLNDSETCTLIALHSQQAVNDCARLRGNSISHFYCQLEAERLQALLGEWLALERERPDFKVLAIEEPLQTEFAGIPLRLRLDRIDLLVQGEQLLLIDYKTGHPSTNAWFGERPDDPQLPLYALVTQPPPAALAFAQLNAHGCEWKGSGHSDVVHPGISAQADWSEQLQEWREQLTQLAQQFLTGDARVDFKDSKAASYATELTPFNRAPEAEAVMRFLDTLVSESHD